MVASYIAIYHPMHVTSLRFLQQGFLVQCSWYLCLGTFYVIHYHLRDNMYALLRCLKECTVARALDFSYLITNLWLAIYAVVITLFLSIGICKAISEVIVIYSS